MFKSTLLVALVASVASVAVAQNSSTLPFPITAVDFTTRSQWCQGEQATCPILCNQDYLKNDCFPETLIYNCTCNNGTAPGLQYYLQTIPTFVCNKVFDICNGEDVTNATHQKACKDAQTADCGTLDPSKFVAPTTTSSSSAVASATDTSQSSSSAASSSTSKAAAPTMAVARELGTGIFAAGAAAAFGLLL